MLQRVKQMRNHIIILDDLVHKLLLVYTQVNYHSAIVALDAIEKLARDIRKELEQRRERNNH